MLDNGPFGDKAAAPDSVVLTKEEKQRLKAGHFRVAISFHYTGTSWAELHEKGICEELNLSRNRIYCIYNIIIGVKWKFISNERKVFKSIKKWKY